MSKNPSFQEELIDLTKQELVDIINETFDVIDDVILKSPEHAVAAKEVGRRVLEFILYTNEKKLEGLKAEHEAIDNLIELSEEMKEEEKEFATKEANNIYS